MAEDRRVCCGEIIPEDRIIYLRYENETNNKYWYVLPARQCGKVSLMRRIIEEWERLIGSSTKQN